MHYFDWNIKSYQSATMHLTNEEDLCYRRLIELYYDTEKPLPNDNPLLTRRLRVGFPELESVLNEFFELIGNEWVHHYCDKVIDEYHAFIDKQRANGSKGGRKNKPTANPPLNQNNPPLNQNNPPLNQNNPTLSQQETINHKPETINQESQNLLSPSATKQPKSDPIPYEKIINLYHQLLPDNPKVADLTAKRKGHIAARWRTKIPDLDTWAEYFRHCAKSNWLTGKCDPSPGRKRFQADIDYLINENNLVKIQENKYHGN